ncbi:MAG: hypothetical protein ABEI74_01045 [Candidatus Pacearchaeota archaeon]
MMKDQKKKTTNQKIQDSNPHSNENLTANRVKRTTAEKNNVSQSDSKKSATENTENKKSQKEVNKGKRNRAAGVRFEQKVRQDLKSKGWVVDKWMNNVDFEKDEIAPAKRKYNPYLKALSIGNGFPDFIAFKREKKGFDVIGVEVKRRGYLDKEEKARGRWYVKNKIFSKFCIAREARNKRDKRKTEIEYEKFEDKYEIE